MRVGLLQLSSGISGDMFLGALVDSGAPLDRMEEAVRAVGGDSLGFRREEVLRAGIRGTLIQVLLDGEPLRESGGPWVDTRRQGGKPRPTPGPRHFSRIMDLLRGAPLDPPVQKDAMGVFEILARAEGRVHGTQAEDVHFHELGTLDTLADVVGVVAGVHALGLHRLLHGPVALGGGTVRTAHGELPVPAPATLAILGDRPCTFGAERGELTTPTGAALVVALGTPMRGELPVEPTAVGYGAGTQDPPHHPNLARLVVGEVQPEDMGNPRGHQAGDTTRLAVIETALDDCTPEEGGHLLERFLSEGALDVTLSPLIMKKGRPGFLLRVLAPAIEGPRFAERVVSLTPSLGARWRIEERRELERRTEQVRLPEGEVRVKVARLPDGRERVHAEYEDVASVARARGASLSEVRDEVERVWRSGG